MEPKYKINLNTGFFGFFLNILTIFLLFFTLACSIPKFAKPSKSDVPVNAKERARKNIDEGRGISLKGLAGGRGKTTFLFSTSNPLWRASLEIIDFMPLATVDYSGGIIITDWYGDSQNVNESIKITIRFLSNEIQSNSIRVIVHNKKCRTEEQCTVNQIDSSIKSELQSSIIKKAAQFDRDAKNSKK